MEFSWQSRFLSQILNQRVQQLVLVAPVWKAWSWYPLLVQMLVREPLLIPQSPETIQQVHMSEQPSRDCTPVSYKDCIRDRCQSGHLSEATTDLILSSWRDKSTKSYNFSFNKLAHYTTFALSSTTMKLFKIKTSKTYVSYVTAFVVLRNVGAQT